MFVVKSPGRWREGSLPEQRVDLLAVLEDRSHDNNTNDIHTSHEMFFFLKKLIMNGFHSSSDSENTMHFSNLLILWEGSYEYLEKCLV